MTMTISQKSRGSIDSKNERHTSASTSPLRCRGTTLSPQVRQLMITDKVSYGDGPGCYEGDLLKEKKILGGTMYDAKRKIKGINEARMEDMPMPGPNHYRPNVE